MTEFVLVLPLLLALILCAVETAALGVRGIIAEHAAYRAARVAEVHQGEHAADEVVAMLHPVFFKGSATDVGGDGDDAVTVDAASRPFIDLSALAPADVLRRRAPKSAALPDQLSDVVLQGGDTPSPYCRAEGSYRVCGYPE